MVSASYPHSFRIAAYGVEVELRANRQDLLDGLRASSNLPFGSEVVPAFATPAKALFHLLAPDTNGGFRVRRAGRTVLDVASTEILFQELHAHLIVAIADHAPDHLFVHAGVMEWHGRAIVLPGCSFAGKTTLVAELVRAGATYYSDEYALIDRDGLIHPFARDLQMRIPGDREQRRLPVSKLGGMPGVAAIPAGAILFVEYKPGSEWSPQPVTPAMAVMEMMRHAPAIRRIPASAMQMLARVTQSAPAFRTSRGDAAATAALILEQFA